MMRNLKIMKKARKLDPDGIYKVVYPPENIFNLSNEEETKISDRAIQFSGWCLASDSPVSLKSRQETQGQVSCTTLRKNNHL